ncbi:MAG: hypothetical protein H8E05_00690 [Bacteroidetes bacterium]|nr:hypothetical protein [Bacteroidota bacterium]
MSPKEQIEYKEESIRYKKVGKRYVPVSYEFDTSGLEKGWYLVKMGEGFTSYRCNVNPANAEVECAVKDAADKLVDILREAHKAKPSKKLTKEQKKDWDELNEKHPEIFDFIQYDSLQGMAEKIVEKLLEEKANAVALKELGKLQSQIYKKKNFCKE